MPVRRASARDLLGMIRRALRLTVLAARNELLLCSFLQLCVGVGLAVQLLVGRDLITDVFGNERGLELGDLAPMLVALAIASGVVAGATVALGERQRILAALVERHIQDRIIDVVVEVPIESFENPVFHDRLRRASQNASERSFQVSIAIVSLLSAVLTSIPIGLVLLRLHPLVLPAVVVAYLPLHLATSRNGRAAYDFNHWMTTSDRERAYLGGLLLAPQPAKEVRLFGSAPWIRRRYDELYDRRILELRRLTRRRLNRSLIATAWSTAVTIGGLAVLIQWSISGRLSAAEAGVAAIAVQQIGSRMRTFGSSAGTLQECSLFLDDAVAFLETPVEASGDALPVAPEDFELLRTEGVAFTYPGSDREVLHEITIELRRGEVVALVGANGSGKTTLAKLLCGLYQPSSGRIVWDGVDLAGALPARCASTSPPPSRTSCATSSRRARTSGSATRSASTTPTRSASQPGRPASTTGSSGCTPATRRG